MEEIKYLPVKVEKVGGKCGIRCTLLEEGRGIFYVNDGTPVSAEILKAEGWDEFRDVLIRIYDMPPCDRIKVFGTGTVGDIVRKTDFIAMRKRLEEYENTPKVGEIWEDKIHAEFKRVIRGVDDEYIKTYGVINGESYMDVRKRFIERFCNTGKTCKSLASFLKELDGLRDLVIADYTRYSQS